MKIGFLKYVALGLGLAMTAPFAHAASIVNGSFEADNWTSYQYDLETSGLTGWTANDPGNNSPLYPWGIDDSYLGNTPYGDQFVVIGGYGADLGTSIQQTVTGLVAGEYYTLSFALASEGYAAGDYTGNANVRVSMLSGSSTASADYAARLSVNTWWDTWDMFTYTFLASDTSATFAFEDLAMTGTGYDIGIDNVSIEGATPMPAPGVLSLLGLGLVGMGFARRRK
jgi:hypothetical protein